MKPFSCRTVAHLISTSNAVRQAVRSGFLLEGLCSKRRSDTSPTKSGARREAHAQAHADGIPAARFGARPQRSGSGHCAWACPGSTRDEVMSATSPRHFGCCPANFGDMRPHALFGALGGSPAVRPAQPTFACETPHQLQPLPAHHPVPFHPISRLSN